MFDLDTSAVDEHTASDAIVGLHKQLVAELHQIDDIIDHHRRRREQMHTVVENLEALYEELPRYSDVGSGEDGPRGQEAVAIILKENPHKWLSIKDITSEMKFRRFIQRDAKNPEAAVRAALRRMDENGDTNLQQKKDGRQVLYRIGESG